MTAAWTVWSLMVAALLQPAPSSVRVLEGGAQSGVDEPLRVVVRTPAEWEALWRRHAPGRPLPEVDFDREMVAAVFLGSRPTAGYSVDVQTATRGADDVLVVEFRESRPADGVMTAQILTAPFQIVVLPRFGGEVSFRAGP